MSSSTSTRHWLHIPGRYAIVPSKSRRTLPTYEVSPIAGSACVVAPQSHQDGTPISDGGQSMRIWRTLRVSRASPRASGRNTAQLFLYLANDHASLNQKGQLEGSGSRPPPASRPRTVCRPASGSRGDGHALGEEHSHLR